MSAKKSQKEKAIEIGEKLRALRKRKQLTLRALAQRSGITVGALSQIENDKTSPSISTLKKVLSALATTLEDFFASSTTLEGDKIVFRHSELVDISNVLGVQYLTFPGHLDHSIELLHETYMPGAGTGPEPYSHKGQECGFCLSGTIEIVVADRREILRTGDAYYYESTRPHSWRNISNRPARVISACHPATF